MQKLQSCKEEHIRGKLHVTWDSNNQTRSGGDRGPGDSVRVRDRVRFGLGVGGTKLWLEIGLDLGWGWEGQSYGWR